MKVFISWSGELSKATAEHLKKWIPCIVQSVEVFFSPEDIEKGENWDSKISQVLSECNYGIICLTSQNVSAPWINFEAGAIAKSLDSRVSCLMVDIKPSDIKGPLSRYQATKFDRKEIFQLISEINKATEQPLDVSRLSNAFEAMWPQLNEDMTAALKSSSAPAPKEPEDPLEEVLQLLRKVTTIVSSPSELLPPDYFDFLRKRQQESVRMSVDIQKKLFDDIYNWINHACDVILQEPDTIHSVDLLEKICFRDILEMVWHYANRIDNVRLNRNIRMRTRQISEKMDTIISRQYATELTDI